MIDRSDLVIRAAEESDGLEACRLLKRLGLTLPDTDQEIWQHWKRLWKRNPYYRLFDEQIQYGWVMEHNKRIVGFFGSIPRIYYWNSKPVPVSIASQWGVEKDYRAHTSLLCDEYFKRNACDLKLVTTAIKPTGRIFERYGGKRVPNDDLALVYMIPIGLFKLMGAGVNSPFLKSVFRRLNGWWPRMPQYAFIRKNKNIRQIQVDSLPSDLDRFFREDHTNVRGLVAARSTEILRWHAAGGEKKPQKVYFAYSEIDRIQGYAAISLGAIPDQPDILRVKIIDLIAESKSIRKSLLKELIRYAYRKKADIVEIHHPGFCERSDIPFRVVLKRRHRHFPLFYQVGDGRLKEELSHPKNWNIAPFDGDTSL
jgi:hypothetical protein